MEFADRPKDENDRSSKVGADGWVNPRSINDGDPLVALSRLLGRRQLQAFMMATYPRAYII